jgi:hypothetical protein
MFIVLIDKIFLISPYQLIPFIRYKKEGIFSIGCYQSISKIIISISWFNTTDTNKCHAWSISKALLVSAGLGRPTPLSHVHIENII